MRLVWWSVAFAVALLLASGAARGQETTSRPPMGHGEGEWVPRTTSGPPIGHGEEERLLGAVLGPKFSRLCVESPVMTPPPPAPVTVCAFVRVEKVNGRPTLLTYTSAALSLDVEVGWRGLWLRVEGAGGGQRHYFEARLVPGVWRHLCLQYDPSTTQAVCYVDDTEEPLASVQAADDDDVQDQEDPSVGAEALAGAGGLVCVGGRLEAGVARLVLWRRLVDRAILGAASGCRRKVRVEAPLVSLHTDWAAEGNATLTSFWRRELCGAAAVRPVVVRPAGSYFHHTVVCRTLGGRLMDVAGLDSATLRLARGDNDTCVGSGRLVTWVVGGDADRPSVTAEDRCPAQGLTGLTQVACVRQLVCSLCGVAPTAVFTLYGHDGRLFDHTFYLHTSEGGAAFRGAGGSRITAQGRGWLLQSELHDEQWSLSDAAAPVGRRRWTQADAEVLLTLTTCRSTQFCCDDGQCVAAAARCDDVVHCGDGSDEAHCGVVQRSTGYDALYPPPPRPGEATPVDLTYDVEVYSLDDITTEGGRATMNVGMTLTWHDPRLVFTNLRPDIKNYFPCELVWTPSVRAVSGHGEGTVLHTTDYDKFCSVYNNDAATQRPLTDPFASRQVAGAAEPLQHYVGMVAAVPCHFQLHQYPFDAQLCNVSFMLMNAPWTRVFRRARRLAAAVPYLNSRRVLLEYVLEGVTTEVGFFLQGTDNNTYFALTLHLRRLYGYHVTNSFFPSLLMFLISYGTFFYQLEDFTNRIMISLTAQLVLAALFTSTTQSSVKTPYLKLIDLWYAAVITFCFVIILAQTVINVLLHVDRVPAVFCRLVALRPFPVQMKGTEGGDSSPKCREGAVVAARYNSVLRLLIIVVATFFVVCYILLAM